MRQYVELVKPVTEEEPVIVIAISIAVLLLDTFTDSCGEILYC